MERMREEFDAWVITRNVCIKYDAKLRTCPDGSYYDYRINDRWLAWKASRAALCVQMPKITDFARDSSGARELLNFEFAVYCVARELNDAGVRYE